MLYTGECLTSAPLLQHLIIALHVPSHDKNNAFCPLTYFSFCIISIFEKALPQAVFCYLYFGTDIIIVFMSYQVHGYKIKRNILRRRDIINFKFPRFLPNFRFLLPEEQSKNNIKHKKSSTFDLREIKNLFSQPRSCNQKWLSVLTLKKYLWIEVNCAWLMRLSNIPQWICQG